MWLLLGLGGLRRKRAAALLYPRCYYSAAGTVHRLRGRGPAARAMRGARNAGHRASPTAGKREGFFF
jgi:hypothetical protein